MEWLDPMDAAMMTAEVLSNPLSVGAVLIMLPPSDAGPRYVDELHQNPSPDEPLWIHGVTTIGGWAWREADSVDLSQHCQRISLAPGSGGNGL